MALLPVVTLLGLWLVLLERRDSVQDGPVHRSLTSFLIAVSFWGAYLAAMDEILGLFHGITLAGISLGWVLLGLVVWWLAWRRQAPRAFRDEFRSLLARSWSKQDLAFLAAVGLEVVVLLIIALASEPNTVDGLRYHLARVAHWQQNASLAHYPSAFYPQLWNAIWAEQVVLHLMIFFGSAPVANMVQWLAMLGSMVGVVAVARLLGVRRPGGLLAVAFLASLPRGILEATSTQTDYVTAFWVITFAYFVLLAHRRKLDRLELTAAAFTLGLGMLTKGTFYPYAAPLVIWLMISLWRREGFKPAVGRGALIAAVAIALNLGFFVRNTITFGGPLGSQQWMNEKTSAVPTLTSVVIRSTQEALLNFPTPSEPLNRTIVQTEHRFEAILGVSHPSFTFIWSWNHEDLAGSPFHLVLIVLALVALLWGLRSQGGLDERSAVAGMLISVLAAFIIYSWLVVFEVWNTRLQLSLFVLWAPLFGVAAGKFLPRKLQWTGAMLLVCFGLPWILFNQTRPLIGWQPRTRTTSVLIAPPDRVLFSNVYRDRVSYEQAAAVVQESSCRDIGLFIDSSGTEYVWWWLLDAPAQGTRIEIVDPLKATQRYVDPSFNPCAMICTMCGDRESWHGLVRAARFEKVSVFLAPSASASVGAGRLSSTIRSKVGWVPAGGGLAFEWEQVAGGRGSSMMER